jgi:photosystem II stability/assembly factor-like uncharacterized protein
VITPSTPQTIYVGTNGGVFKSVNGGEIWSAVNNGLTSTNVLSLAIDQSTPQTIYAGTYGGVFKSVNSGESWNAVNTGLTGTYNVVMSLIIDTSTPQTVYAGTFEGVFKSVNGGGSWSAVNTGLPASSSVTSLTIDPSTPQIIYAGTFYDGVFKSTNGGMSWSLLNTGLTGTALNFLTIDSSTPQTLYAGTAGSLIKSVNGGSSWNAVTGVSGVSYLVINPSTPQTLYAGTDGGVFKTINGGTNWSDVNAGLKSTVIFSLAIDPSTPQTIYSGTYTQGIFKSTNSGASWSEVNAGLTNKTVHSLAIDPSTPQTVYAGTGSGVFKSVNGGTSWSAANTGLTGMYVSAIYSLAIDPSTNQTVYAATMGGVFKSVNGGTSWSAINSGLANTYLYSLAIDPSTPQTVYAGRIDGGVYKTINGGASWSAVNITLTTSSVNGLAIDPSTPQTVYAGTGDGIFKSLNGGAGWTAMTGVDGVYSLVIDPIAPQNLYVGTYKGVFKSVNSGVNWSSVNTGLTNPDVRAIAIDPFTPQNVYAGTYGGGLFKTQSGSSDLLTVTKSGTGSGSVFSSPAHISCGATCSAPFITGTSVILTAMSESSSTFAGWNGVCSGTGTCTVTMDAAKSVEAVFTAMINGVCGADNGVTFNIAPSVNLCSAGIATSVTGTSPWTWSCTGLYGGVNANCSASIQTYAVTSGVTGGNGTVDCTNPVNYGANSTCTITPSIGFKLATFSDNTADKLLSVNAGSYTITNVTAAHSIAATFTVIPLIPVNGSCGTSNGGTFNIVPTANLCSTGAASSVTNSGSWDWVCSGTNGGAASNCSANIAFTVTPTTGSGFTFTPSIPQVSNKNGSASFTVASAPGYGISSVSGCGGSLIGTTFTTGPITADCSISVTAVARNANSGGSTAPPTITDALKVLQAVVGITPLTPTEQIRYDVAPLSANGTPFGNGAIDAADVILILRRSIGIGSW